MVDRFSIGELVTGKDRSYRRSIYQVISQNEDFLFVRLVVFEGRLGSSFNGNPDSYERRAHEFRSATKEEVRYELGLAHSMHLLGFVKMLLRVKRSYLVRRSLG